MQARTLSSLLVVLLGLLRSRLVLADDLPRIDPRATVAAPIVIAASQNWDGNDGPWSSFPIQIGTPSQDVRVMISTSGHQTLAVIPGGCIATDPSNCESLRGGFFEPNASSTWQFNEANSSSYIYPLLIDEQLEYTPSGELGFDDITLGWQGSGGPTLDNQTVAAFEDKDFYLGYFGISPRASNFTNFDNPIPSYMQNLKNKSLIPSLSWSYTAGNQYRLDQVLGSLVLGGYDTSRFVPNDVTFPFASQDIRDLTVQLEAITMSDKESTGNALLPSTIPALVDSSLPFIWLPVEACTLFEKAFGLVWDDDTELYLLNSTHQAALHAQNASITFTLGNLTAGANVNITLPYAAFDLAVSSPIVNTSTPYFPLKRAVNSTQYTLGRTFFQEAYVTADYERGNFSVSQCSWVANSPQNVVAIFPPSAAPSNSTSGSSGNSSSSSGVSAGAVAGGVVGGVVVLATAGLLLWYFCIKPRRRRAEAEAAAAAVKASESEQSASAQPSAGDDSAYRKAELDSSEVRRAEMEDPTKNQWVVETDGNALRPQNEMEGSSTPKIHEMDGKRYYEMDGKKYLYPVEADGREVEIHEMPAREEVAAEMTAQRDSIVRAPQPRWGWATTPGGDLASPAAQGWSERDDLPNHPMPSLPISEQRPEIPRRSPHATEQSPQISQGSPQSTQRNTYPLTK